VVGGKTEKTQTREARKAETWGCLSNRGGWWGPEAGAAGWGRIKKG
jgi:hypothetical protein